MALIGNLLGFIINLIISGVVIYIATKLFGEDEGFSTAILTAFIGAIIWAVISYLIGGGMIASIIGGIAWLMAIRSMYNVGWLKSIIIAVFIWLIAQIVGIILPSAVIIF